MPAECDGMKTASNLDLDDITRLEKRGVRLLENLGQHQVVSDGTDPLHGVVTKQRIRARKAGDVLNIGSGTRCQHCGMLYFCWVAKCSSCNKTDGRRSGQAI